MHTNFSLAAAQAANIQALSTQLADAQRTIAELSTTNGALKDLITDYENALTLLLEKLHSYAFTHTSTTLGLHKHYQELLEEERRANVQMRNEHADWQAGLGRVAEYARAALLAQSDADLPLKRELKALKEENRVLRRLAGWEEKEDSSDEEEEERKMQ